MTKKCKYSLAHIHHSTWPPDFWPGLPSGVCACCFTRARCGPREFTYLICLRAASGRRVTWGTPVHTRRCFNNTWTVRITRLRGTRTFRQRLMTVARLRVAFEDFHTRSSPHDAVAVQMPRIRHVSKRQRWRSPRHSTNNRFPSEIVTIRNALRDER